MDWIHEMIMDWAQVIVTLGVNFAVVIALFLHSDRKMEANRRETNELIKAIKEDMKDFHERLIKIEERTRK